ncbi:uncharacterized protein LOC103717312 [Phoenix dactylifera]|uniref:Uncharacterized protein LOC103717312 n=1 Tax=Phoenix dactylifera TaxID=42345 RepID=A0A8B7CPZ5_PHODC|nr:uncharacterized protein LOC103717312 [Phoenix dactylifera]
MATDSNMGFRQGTIPSSFCDRLMLSFQSGARNSTTEMISGGMSSSGMNSSTCEMFLSGNPSMINNIPAISAAGSSSSNVHHDHVHRFKPGTVSGSDWSAQEAVKLNEGLTKYAHEPNFMKYIKIAAMLPEKTIRDVALRCRWMSNKQNGKRRNLEEHYAGKKIKDTKEKMVASSSTAKVHMVPSDNMPPYSLMMHHNVNHFDHFSHEGPALDGAIRHLLDENVQMLCQISANLSTFKIQENIELFLHTRNNFTSILRRMSELPPTMNQVPGIMSPLPHLPVLVNEELLKSVVSFNEKDVTYGAPSGVNP